MYRGFIFQWRKDVDSDIWDKPPLYYKVWEWLNLSVDKETGSIDRTLRQIADAVMWHERGAPRIPNPKTISDILAYLEEQEMVTKEMGGGGNARYWVITICNWWELQHPKKCLSNTGETEKVTDNGALYKKYQDKQESNTSGSDEPEAAAKDNYKAKVLNSPHAEYLQNLGRWFYGHIPKSKSIPDVFITHTKRTPEGSAVWWEALNVARITLESQMPRYPEDDAPKDAEKRLYKLLIFAVDDDMLVTGRDFGWKRNLESLSALNSTKKKGSPKWRNIEKSSIESNSRSTSSTTHPNPPQMKRMSDFQFKVLDSNYDPITDPEWRREKILARNPHATEDPDQGQPFTLSSDYITRRSATP